MTGETGRLLEECSKTPTGEPEKAPQPSTRSSGIMGRLVVILFLAGFLTLFTSARGPEVALSIDQRADRILSETPLIGRYSTTWDSLGTNSVPADGHDDLPILVRMLFKNRIYGDNFTIPFTNGTMKGHVDLPRLSQGKVGGTFWSVFVECPKDGMDFSDENYATSKDTTE